MRLISLLLLASLSTFSWGAYLIEEGTQVQFEFVADYDTVADPPTLSSFSFIFDESNPLSNVDGVQDSFTLEIFNPDFEEVDTDSYATPEGDLIIYCNCIDINLPDSPVQNPTFTVTITGTSGSFSLEEVYGFILSDDNSSYIQGSYYDPTPPDPNEPDEEYPEAVVVYQPDFPTLGVYSEPDVCVPQHDTTSPKVVLGELAVDGRESLDDAFERLKQLSNQQGGIIEVPWDADTIQCDRFAYGLNDDVNGTMPVSLNGTVGPNGEIPRFYCRKEANDGTVPGGGATFFGAGTGNGKPLPRVRNVHIENIHVDGYGGWVSTPNAGRAVFRNNYFHHATSDGVKGVGINREQHEGFGATIEFCGNEISHAGASNAHHCFYIAGSDNFDHGDMGIKVKLIDNVVHSCNESSGYKSTTRTTLIKGNKFYNTLSDDPATPKYENDPSYAPRKSLYSVDMVACAIEHQIVDNYFYKYIDDDDINYGNIGIRNRRQFNGCDMPYAYMLNPDADQSVGGPDLVIPDDEGYEFWSSDWWLAKNNEKDLQIYLTGNVFENEGPKFGDADAVGNNGTYPDKRWPEASLSQFTCLLEPPHWEGVTQWFERSEVITEANTYIGYTPGPEGPYGKNPPDHSGTTICGYELPQPDLRDYDTLFRVVGNELNLPDDVILPTLADNQYVKLNDVSDGCTGPETGAMAVPCQQWATYSGFECDDVACYGMGGGHASTQTDQVFIMPLATLEWGELYPPTKCGTITTDDNWYLNEAEMLADNPQGLPTWVNRTDMTTTYNDHVRPLPFHSYDNITVVDGYLYEFNLKGHESSSSVCDNPNIRQLTSVGSHESMRVNLHTRKWELTGYGWGADVVPSSTSRTAGATAVGSDIYVWGKEGISVVDTTLDQPTKTWRIQGTVLGGLEPSIDYAEDGDTILNVTYNSGVVQFSKYNISTNLVTSLAPAQCSFTTNKGFVFDPGNNVMGRVRNGYYEVFDWVNKRCGAVLVDASPSLDLSIKFQAADVIQDDLFVFINTDYETVAYRIPDITGLVVWEE